MPRNNWSRAERKRMNRDQADREEQVRELEREAHRQWRDRRDEHERQPLTVLSSSDLATDSETDSSPAAPDEERPAAA